ncbi:MAG: hypothetical protein K8T10_09510 [Candidatus Eremiobacteraeota bacterium]|nr:hypothetical protein [Candidatus Eremiobacteraeota bacterium]
MSKIISLFKSQELGIKLKIISIIIGILGIIIAIFAFIFKFIDKEDIVNFIRHPFFMYALLFIAIIIISFASYLWGRRSHKTQSKEEDNQDFHETQSTEKENQDFYLIGVQDILDWQSLIEKLRDGKGIIKKLKDLMEWNKTSFLNNIDAKKTDEGDKLKFIECLNDKIIKNTDYHDETNFLRELALSEIHESFLNRMFEKNGKLDSPLRKYVFNRFVIESIFPDEIRKAIYHTFSLKNDMRTIIKGMSQALEFFIKAFGEDIVVFRVTPFELYKKLFNGSEQKYFKNFNDSLNEIIEEPKEDNEQYGWFDQTIYGRLGVKEEDIKTVRGMREFYSVSGGDNDMEPDTSTIAFNHVIKNTGILMIGKLNDIYRKRWKDAKDKAQVVPCKGKNKDEIDWKCGFWLFGMGIVNSENEDKKISLSTNIFTTNRYLLKVMETYFISLLNDSVKKTLSNKDEKWEQEENVWTIASRIIDGNKTFAKCFHVEVSSDQDSQKLTYIIFNVKKLTEWFCDEVDEIEEIDEITGDNMPSSIIFKGDILDEKSLKTEYRENKKIKEALISMELIGHKSTSGNRNIIDTLNKIITDNTCLLKEHSHCMSYYKEYDDDYISQYGNDLKITRNINRIIVGSFFPSGIIENRSIYHVTLKDGIKTYIWIKKSIERDERKSASLTLSDDRRELTVEIKEGQIYKGKKYLFIGFSYSYLKENVLSEDVREREEDYGEKTCENFENFIKNLGYKIAKK